MAVRGGGVGGRETHGRFSKKKNREEKKTGLFPPAGAFEGGGGGVGPAVPPLAHVTGVCGSAGGGLRGAAPAPFSGRALPLGRHAGAAAPRRRRVNARRARRSAAVGSSGASGGGSPRGRETPPRPPRPQPTAPLPTARVRPRTGVGRRLPRTRPRIFFFLCFFFFVPFPSSPTLPLCSFFFCLKYSSPRVHPPFSPDPETLLAFPLPPPPPLLFFFASVLA